MAGVDPGEDTPFEGGGVGVSESGEKETGVCTPHALGAIDDDFALRGDLPMALA